MWAFFSSSKSGEEDGDETENNDLAMLEGTTCNPVSAFGGGAAREQCHAASAEREPVVSRVCLFVRLFVF